MIPEIELEEAEHGLSLNVRRERWVGHINLFMILRSSVVLAVRRVPDAGVDQALWYRTPRAFVNASNPQWPWYLPMPELPTPPNGSCGTSGWRAQSLTHASPELVRSRMSSTTDSSSLKTVEPERGGPLVDPVDHLLDRIDLEHRQDRAEDLLPHDLRVERDVDEHRRRDVELVGVGLAACGDGSVRDQPGQAVEGPAVDDPAVVRALSSGRRRRSRGSPLSGERRTRP